MTMGKEYEDALPLSDHTNSSKYFQSFVNELVGNLFVGLQSTFEDANEKLILAQIAARIYLEGGHDPGVFIGYPISKILIKNDLKEAKEWIKVLQQRSEQVRKVPANKLDLLIDLADRAQMLEELMEQA